MWCAGSAASTRRPSGPCPASNWTVRDPISSTSVASRRRRRSRTSWPSTYRAPSTWSATARCARSWSSAIPKPASSVRSSATNSCSTTRRRTCSCSFANRHARPRHARSARLRRSSRCLSRSGPAGCRRRQRRGRAFEDLAGAVRACGDVDRSKCRARALEFSWHRSVEQFEANLVRIPRADALSAA